MLHKKWLVITLFFLFIGAALVSYVVINNKSGGVQNKEALAELGFFLFSKPRVLSDTQLQNLTGQAKPLYDHLEGWRLVNFGYLFCPDICPLNLATLNQLKKDWQAEQENQNLPDLSVLHITFDPERDTPQLLGDYLDLVNPDFYGLTGKLDDIRLIAKQLNMIFFHEKPDERGHYFISHSDSIALLNPKGEYIGLFKGPYDQGKMKSVLSSILNK